MRLVIEMNLDNDAFEPDWKVEAERLLRKAASRLWKLEPGTPMRLIDFNGNTVGSVRLQRGD